jgi:hypothetical protein
MSVFRRANSQQSGPGGPASARGISRFSRLVGRLLLWGCVLLLLVRGIASYLNDEPRRASRPRVTVTPRVAPVAPNKEGR